MMKKILQLAILTGLAIFLSGCFSYRVQQQDIGNVFTLNHTYVLLETKHFLIPMQRFSLCTIGRCGTILPNFPKTIREYQENMSYWQQWRGGMGYSERIATLIPKGTHYVILSRHSGTFNSEPFETIRLVDGPLPKVTTYLFS